MFVDSTPYQDAGEHNILAMMASLHQRLSQQLKGDREHAFYTHSLQLLTTISGHQVDLSSWTITPYEVELGRQIGYGGLYGHFSQKLLRSGSNLTIYMISGQVYEGRWNRTSVAIKVLRSKDGITPSSEVCHLVCLVIENH